MRPYRRLIDAYDETPGGVGETPIGVGLSRCVDRYVEPYRCLGKLSHLTPQDIWQDNTQDILLILLQVISFDPSRYRGKISHLTPRVIWQTDNLSFRRFGQIDSSPRQATKEPICRGSLARGVAKEPISGDSFLGGVSKESILTRRIMGFMAIGRNMLPIATNPNLIG